MKTLHILKQRGAALAFSLVMLMLLTLVSVSMIQQNKSQITMTSNSSQQTTSFSSVETALANALNIINQKRYQDQAAHKCKATDQLNENYVLNLGSTNITGKITQVFCLSNYDGTSGDEYRCLYQNGSRNLVVGIPYPTDDNVDACKRLNNAGIAGPAIDHCNAEIYTVNIGLIDSTTGAQRTIESKFEVNCAGDIT